MIDHVEDHLDQHQRPRGLARGVDVAETDGQQRGHREVEGVQTGVEADDLVRVRCAIDVEAEGETEHRDHQREHQSVDASARSRSAAAGPATSTIDRQQARATQARPRAGRRLAGDLDGDGDREVEDQEQRQDARQPDPASPPRHAGSSSPVSPATGDRPRGRCDHA